MLVGHSLVSFPEMRHTVVDRRALLPLVAWTHGQIKRASLHAWNSVLLIEYEMLEYPTTLNSFAFKHYRIYREFPTQNCLDVLLLANVFKRLSVGSEGSLASHTSGSI